MPRWRLLESGTSRGGSGRVRAASDFPACVAGGGWQVPPRRGSGSTLAGSKGPGLRGDVCVWEGEPDKARPTIIRSSGEARKEPEGVVAFDGFQLGGGEAAVGHQALGDDRRGAAAEREVGAEQDLR